MNQIGADRGMKRTIHRAMFVAHVALVLGIMLAMLGDFLDWWNIVDQPLLALCFLVLSFVLYLTDSVTQPRVLKSELN